MSTWSGKEERRAAVRLDTALEASISFSGGRFQALTTDLSPHGILVETDRQLPRNTVVRVEFELAQGGRVGRVVADGRVARTVRSRRKDRVVRGLGIRFDDLIQGRDLLRRYVDGRLMRTDTLIIRFKERRTESRINVGLPVRWGTSPTPDREGLLTSLSATGSFFITGGEGIETGTRVYLTFEITEDNKTQSVRAVGRVVRSTEGASGKTGLAIHFDVASMDIEAITWFVRQRAEGSK